MAYLGTSPSNGVRRRFIYTATANQTSFSGNDDNGTSLVYVDVAYLDVYQNGVKLKSVSDYASTTGTSVVLVQGASADDVVEIISFDVFSIGDTVSAADGGSFGGNIGMGGTLAVTGASTLTGAVTAASSLAMTSNDPTITMTDSSGTNDIVTLQSTSGALIITARDGNANGEIIFKGNTGSAVTEHMRINSIGAITKPLQPAFCAFPASQVNNLAINTTHNPIAFGTERFDNNGDFASNTFTAPVTGKYQLQFTLYLLNADVDTQYIETHIVTSNESYVHLFHGASGDTDWVYHTIQNSVIADMDANDTAKITLQIPNNGAAQMDIGTDSFFSGALLC